MMPSILVPFPPGEILDRWGVVGVSLPPGAGLSRARVLGTCAQLCSGDEIGRPLDPMTLRLDKVTIEQGSWRLELLSAGQEASFPSPRSFLIAVQGLEQHDVQAWSTVDNPVKVTVCVRRLLGVKGAVDTRIVFRLGLMVHSFSCPEAFVA